MLASLFLSFLLDNAAIVPAGEQLHIRLLKATAYFAQRKIKTILVKMDNKINAVFLASIIGLAAFGIQLFTVSLQLCFVNVNLFCV